MSKANVIPCDFNIAFYTVMGKVKYDDYQNLPNTCVWYKKDNNIIGNKKKVAHYDKKQEMLWIYD